MPIYNENIHKHSPQETKTEEKQKDSYWIRKICYCYKHNYPGSNISTSYHKEIGASIWSGLVIRWWLRWIDKLTRGRRWRWIHAILIIVIRLLIVRRIRIVVRHASFTSSSTNNIHFSSR